MVRRIGGPRRKSRNKFTKHYRRKGKKSMSDFFQVFTLGDRVSLVGETSHPDGFYRARFHGQAGSIEGKQGSCYKVRIVDGNKPKILYIHPVHLKRV